MKVTLNQLFEAHPAFELLAIQYFSLDKIAPAIYLIDQINVYYAEMAKKQEELLSFYGTKNEETGKYDIDDEKKPFYEMDLKEYLSAEVELDWKPVSVHKLGDIRMPIAAYEMLKFLFTEEIEEILALAEEPETV